MSSQVEQWLRKNGLEKYIQAFADNYISIDLVPHLTDADLKELGFGVGHKIVFRKAAGRLTKGDDSLVQSSDIVSDLGPPKFAGERKLITVLFCDVVESTRLSTLIDAEELDHVLQAFFTQCATIVQSFGGILAAKLGDGAVCWFGWPRAHEDDALRAVHAALTMAREAPAIRMPSSLDWQLNVRVAIATGHVVISGIAGNDIPQIVGETPSRAERIKAVCPVASVVIDPTTRSLVGANFDLVELGPHQLKGFGEPVEICQVIAPRAGVTRFEGSHSGVGVRRLVDRQGDMAMLKSRWELAYHGEGQAVLLTGQAGIGKSRVVAALVEHAAERRSHLQLYQCSHLYQNTALHPVIARFMRDAKIKLADEPDEKLKKLYRLPDIESAANEQIADLFASLLSIPAHEGFLPPSMSPENWRVAVFDAILQAISRLAAQEPLLLVVEDVHWIDPTSLELLDTIVDRSAKLPILVMMTSRGQDLSGRWKNANNFAHLQLGRLSPSQSRELCREVVGSEAARAAQFEQIMKAAEGVPLFLEELAKHAQETPAGEVAGRGTSQGSLALHSTIPDHLSSLLAERLDRLDVQTGAKRVAQTAAVFGHDFSVALLAKVPSLQRVGDMHAAVDQLLKAGLVVKSVGAAQGTLSFRHSVFREVAHESLLRSTRRVLHGEIATVLVEAGVAEADPDIVAHHFTEGHKPREAIAYWTKAGLRSGDRSATVEAFSQFSKGLELVRQLPDESATHELELPLRVGFGGVASAIEGYSAKDIEENYARMLVLSGLLNRPSESFRAHLGLGAFYEVGGDLEKSQLHCDECLRSAELSGDHEELLHAHRLLGELNFFKGEFESSFRHFDSALSLYDARDHLRLISALGDDPGVLSRMYGALSLWFLGFPDQAAKSCGIGLQLAHQLGHAFTSAQADFYASWLYAFARDLARAKSFAERAIECSAAQQFALVLGCSQVIKGWAMSGMNDHVAGQKEILEGMALIRGPRADICESAFLSMLADYHRIAGDFEKGLSVLEESRAVAAERFGDADRLRLQGELLVPRDVKAAENLLREAMATAHRQKSLSMALRSALSLYRLLNKLGRIDEGEVLLRQVYDQFTEGFETTDLLEVGAILRVTNSALMPDGAGR